MLSKQEKRNCSDILELLPDEDIFSLMHTTTNRTVSAKNREEAVSAILQFTQSIDEFFKRRKISKDLLLKYIYKKSWFVPKDHDLHDLKDYIILEWVKSQRKYEASSVKTKPVVEAPQCNPVPERTAAYTQMNNYNMNKYVHNSINNHTVVNIQLPKNSCEAPDVAASSKSQEHQSAMSFTRWFFSLLNSHNPNMGLSKNDFGPQHFWRNAQMRLEMITQGKHVSETFEGAEAVAGKLLSFPVSDRLLFSPSDSVDGLKITTDAFGRKVILVCGLVHKDGICVGYFCQTFGLIGDPAMNNTYKVRVTMLKMNENRGQSPLALTFDNDAAVMEDLTVSAVKFSQ